MIYAVADIHGCYQEFLQLLEKINFTDEDEMYIALKRVLDNPADLDSYREKSIQRSKFFSSERIIEEIIDLF